MVKNAVIVTDEVEATNGAANVAQNTAVLLAQRGIDVYFFAGAGGIHANKLLNDCPGIKVISLGMTVMNKNPNALKAAFQGFYNFRAASALRKLLGSLDSSETIVHIHTWSQILSPSVLKAASDMKFRTFITIHDYFLVCPNYFLFNYVSGSICEIPPMSLRCILCNCDKRNYFYKLWRCARQFMQNRIVHNIMQTGGAGCIFISEFSKQQLLRRMPAPRNQFFLQNSVYFSARFRAPAENNSAFLFIGRLSEEKGIRTFCEAVQNSGVHGVVIGDGFLRDELEHQYPEITFTGWLDQSQIREWFRKTRCLVFPSICYETFGLTALEANAYGIPVIAPSWSAASDNASFVYHSQTELEDMMRRVNSLDIKALSEKIYNNFDESITTNYADNLLKIYESPLA